MENFGAFIYIVIMILYAIYRASETVSGRRSGYGRYGVFGMQDDFSLEYDPLEDIRKAYEERLQIYYRNNKPKTYLINKYCEARLIKEDNGDIWFYVKNRTKANSKFSGAYFEVKGNNTHASTMWAIIDMEFNSFTKYDEIRDLYLKLNQGYNTTGGLKYFYQLFTGGLPKPVVNKFAQNEFCRMEIETLPSGEKVIICSEIWGPILYYKPRKFVIKADKLTLYSILSEFSKDKNKMKDYLSLLSQYVKRTDCTIRDISEKIEIENTVPQTQINTQKTNNEVKTTEQTESIQIDLDKQIEQKDDTEIEIKKYDERNLDL